MKFTYQSSGKSISDGVTSTRPLWRSLRHLAIAATVLFFGGCGQPSQKRAHTTPLLGQTLRLNIQGEPNSLDPRISAEMPTQALIKHLFEGLTRNTPDGQLSLAIAHTILASEDGTHYTIRLRPSKWSNGSDLTADDFVYAWSSLLDPNFATAHAYGLYVIKNARAVKEGSLPLEALGVSSPDPLTLLVELEHPAPYFPDLLANSVFSPVCRIAIEANPNWARDPDSFVCNGPFHISRWHHDDRLTMVKNPYYWDRQAVKLDAIQFSMVRDPLSAFHMFEQGELDWIGAPLCELPTETTDHYSGRGILVHQPINCVHNWVFNTQKAPFTSKAMRQAFATAIDRESLRNSIMRGGWQVAGSVLPPAQTLHPQPLMRDGDQQQAQQLFEQGLRDLGLTKENLPPIIITYSTRAKMRPLAQAIQQQWRETFGIKVELEESDWASYIARFTSRDFQFGYMGWRSWFNDPLAILDWLKYGQGMNGSGWENPEYVALLDASDREPNPHLRRDYLRQAENLVMDESPVTPLFIFAYTYITNSQLHGVYLSEMGDLDFRWAYFEPTPGGHR